MHLGPRPSRITRRLRKSIRVQRTSPGYLSLIVSLVALTISGLSFYNSYVRRIESVSVFIGQQLDVGDAITLQTCVINGGNRQVVIPSIGVLGSIPNEGYVNFEALSAPLVLPAETSAITLLRIPRDLSGKISARNARLGPMFQFYVAAVYPSKHQYVTWVRCAPTFNGTRLSTLRCPKTVFELQSWLELPMAR